MTEMCLTLKNLGLEHIYPYVNIVLRMYLYCATSNYTSERSFSALKRTISNLRSKMTDE